MLVPVESASLVSESFLAYNNMKMESTQLEEAMPNFILETSSFLVTCTQSTLKNSTCEKKTDSIHGTRHKHAVTYKIFRRLGSDIGTKFKGDPSNIFSTNFHVKVDCKEGQGQGRLGNKRASSIYRSCVVEGNLPFGLAIKAEVAREKARAWAPA